MSRQSSSCCVTQPVVCMECGRILKRLDWDHIETCPIHRRAYSGTLEEYQRQQKKKQTKELFGMW